MDLTKKDDFCDKVQTALQDDHFFRLALTA
jgi:hypothetical protein